MKAKNKAPVDFADEFSPMSLDAADALEAPAVALLYQGGYLTIDELIDDFYLKLKIPNLEVETSLYRGHMSHILGKGFEIDGFTRNAEKTAKALLAEFANLLRPEGPRAWTRNAPKRRMKSRQNAE